MMNKKSNVTYVYASVIVAVVGFLVLLNFYIVSSQYVVKSADESACRFFVSGKDTLPYKVLGEFLKDMNVKCKKDNIEIKGSKKDKVFEQVADRMASCWHRYGEGEYDFLSNFNAEGNWCFTCSKLTFEQDSGVYSYSGDFVPWLYQNKVELKNGTKHAYADFINLKMVSADENTLIEIDKNIEELNEMMKDGDPTMRPLVYNLAEKNQEFKDLAMKKVETGEELYIVYRYDRLEKSTLETMTQVGIGMAVGIGLEFVVEGVLTAGIGIPLKIIKGAVNAGKLIKYTQKINKILEFFGKSVKFTKPAKAIEVVTEFDGTVAGFRGVGKALEKSDLELAQKTFKSADKMQEAGITKIEDIPSLIQSKTLKLENLQEVTVDAINKDMLNSNAIRRLATTEKKYALEIEDLKKLQEEINQILAKSADVNKLDEVQKQSLISKSTDYLKRTARLTAAAAGGSVGYMYNNNNIQYVDLLTKEQYYRLCGPEPVSFG